MSHVIGKQKFSFFFVNKKEREPCFVIILKFCTNLLNNFQSPYTENNMITYKRETTDI